MSSSLSFESPSLWQRIVPLFRGFDGPLAFAVFLLACAGLTVMYSSGYDHGTRFADHGRNMLIAGFIMFTVAQLPPQRLMMLAVPLYTLGVALLVATALFGITKKGATRWLNVGVVIQPSELLKLATPLMLAWWFQTCENRQMGQLRWPDFAVAGVLMIVFALVDADVRNLGKSEANVALPQLETFGIRLLQLEREPRCVLPRAQNLRLREARHARQAQRVPVRIEEHGVLGEQAQ